MAQMTNEQKNNHKCTESDALLVIHMLNEYYKGHDMLDKIITDDAMYTTIEALKKDGIIE